MSDKVIRHYSRPYGDCRADKRLYFGGSWPWQQGAECTLRELPLFAAIKADGIFRTSTDGVTWNYKASVPNITDAYSPVQILYGDGVILIPPVAYSTPNVAISNDMGISWITTTLPVSDGVDITQGAYGNGKFVLVGEEETIIYSIDKGLTWHIAETNSDNWSTDGYYSGIIFVNGRFIATRSWYVYNNETKMNDRYIGKYSDDGINWTPMKFVPREYSPNGEEVFTAQNGCISYTNGVLCMVGSLREYKDSTNWNTWYNHFGSILSHDLGATWSECFINRSLDADQSFGMYDVDSCNLLTAGNDIFVSLLLDASITEETKNLIIYSPDGMNWTTSSLGSSIFISNDPPVGICYSNGMFMAHQIGGQTQDSDTEGSSSEWFTSINGINWISHHQIDSIDNYQHYVGVAPLTTQKHKIYENYPIIRNTVVPVNSAFDTPSLLIGNTGTVYGKNHNASATNIGYICSEAVWWKWIPTTSGWASINTEGSNFRHYLTAVSFENNEWVLKCGYFSDSGHSSRIDFEIESGREYRIMVGGCYQGSHGDIVLNYTGASDAVRPINDSLSTATTVSGLSGTLIANTFNPLIEPGEDSRGSVWWKWTPSVSATAVIYSTPSTYSGRIINAALPISNVIPTISVYKLNGELSYTNLTFLTDSYYYDGLESPATFDMAAGQTYYFCVDLQGYIKLNYNTIPTPINNFRSNATELIDNSGSIECINIGATKQADDSGTYGIWYKWTPTISGSATISILETNFNSRFTLQTFDKQYMGSIWYPIGSTTKPVTAGSTYYICVYGEYASDYQAATGSCTLNYSVV